MRNVDLKAILKPFWNFLKRFRRKQKKTSTTITISIGDIHIDEIKVNVCKEKSE